MRKTVLSIAVCSAAIAAAPTALAHDDGGSYSGGGSSWTGSGGWGSYGGDRPERAVSYINPDTGAATANPDVAANSSCFAPDRYDVQRLSDPGTANRNVHNDACFFGSSYSSGSDTKLDAPATYQSTGVGFISACPDPDGAGPKFAVLSDTNGDGRNDRCFQSGYQTKGAAGDQEFHARLNNSTTEGRQTVVWCYDADRDGCSDEYVRDTIRVDWTR